MSAEIESSLKEHTLVEFFGGTDRGVCLQVTGVELIEGNAPFIQLDITEAAELAYRLAKYCEREAKRRQALLNEQIAEMKELEKTVFAEIRDLDIGKYEVSRLMVSMVNSLTPK